MGATCALGGRQSRNVHPSVIVTLMYERSPLGFFLPFFGALLGVAAMFGAYGFWATAPLVVSGVVVASTALWLFRTWRFSDARGVRLVLQLGVVAGFGLGVMWAAMYALGTAQALL